MILEAENLIVNRKNGTLEKALFFHIQKIKNSLLKTNYNLSLNFISPQVALALNQKYRKKNYIPNILSFPLSSDSGEIFICLSVARQEAKKFSLTYRNFLTLLIIHGFLHLKGYEHGKVMENLEKKNFKKFMLK